MADNGSANRANNRAYRQAQSASRPRVNTGTGATYQASSPKQRAQARQQKARQAPNRTRTTNKTRTREFHIHINKNGDGGSGAGAAGQWSRQSPIGDAEFLSAGHVRAFAERGRRAMRQAAMDFSYAAETLKAVLKEVPPPADENRMQMHAKARRTARNLKRAANAAQAASAHSARTWPAYMREYAQQLNQYGGPRPQQRAQRMNFGA